MSNDSNIHTTVRTLICFEYLAAGGALVVFYSLLAMSRWEKFHVIGKFFADIGIPCTGIMLYIVARDVYVYLYSGRMYLSEDWLLAFPFPVIIPSSFLVNLVMSCLTVAFITDHFHLPSILVIFSFLPCERRLRKCIKIAVQITLVFSIANLLVLLLFHLAWVVLAFAAYPVYSIGSLAFVVPLLLMVLDLFFLIEFIADARILYHEFGDRVKKMVFTLLGAILLGPFFIAIFGVLYCYSRVIVNVSGSKDYPIASLIVGAAPNVTAVVIVQLASNAIKALINEKHNDQTLLQKEDDQKQYDSD